MADFRTNALNLAELDLALLEIESIAGIRPSYGLHGRLTIAEKLRPTQDYVPDVLKRCAYVSNSVGFDGRPDAESEWTKMRREKPDALMDYSTHNLWPFVGKMMPQLARALINICLGAEEHAKIADPFCGSGTTLLEGALLGHNVYGCDVDSFAVWLTAAKLSPTAALLDDAIAKLEHDPRPLDAIRLEAVRLAYRRCHRVADFEVRVSSADEFLRMTRLYDAIVTSPPYFCTIDYVERHQLMRRKLGLDDPSGKSMGVGQTLEEYEDAVVRVCRAMANSLRRGGRCAVVIGNSKSVPSSEWYELHLKSSGLRLFEKLNRPYAAPTSEFVDETILLLEKPDADAYDNRNDGV